MTPGRLSLRREFTPVSSHGVALYLFTLYHHKMSCRRESPRRKFTPVVPGQNFTSVRNLATVTYKRETTTRCEIGLPVDWNAQHMRNVCDFEPLVIYHSMFVIYSNYSQTVFKPLLVMLFCTYCSVCLRRFNFQVIKKNNLSTSVVNNSYNFTILRSVFYSRNVRISNRNIYISYIHTNLMLLFLLVFAVSISLLLLLFFVFLFFCFFPPGAGGRAVVVVNYLLSDLPFFSQ